MTGMTWAEQELGDASLGDARLSRRLVKLATRLAESPSSSIPQACRGWAEMRAAYRFLAQDKLDWQDMLQPHWDASAQRMREHPVVLCLQDTTELDFEGKATRGLGPLSYEAQRGLYLHPTYAVTPGRVPLGVIDAWMWAREFKDQDGQRGGLCESMRWIEGYERVAEQAKQMPGTRLVYVADREGDIVELMRRARDLGHPADWLIRSKHDRSLGKGAGKLSAALQDAPVLGVIEFDMAARQGVQARRVRHILFAVTPGVNVPALAQRAEAALLELSDKAVQPERFAQLAAELSNCPSGAQGGDLGWANPGMFVPEFEEAMNRLAPNEISAPLVSRFGVHLIQVLERKDVELSPKAQRDQLKQLVREQKMEEAYKRWIEEVRSSAYVEYRDAPQ